MRFQACVLSKYEFLVRSSWRRRREPRLPRLTGEAQVLTCARPAAGAVVPLGSCKRIRPRAVRNIIQSPSRMTGLSRGRCSQVELREISSVAETALPRNPAWCPLNRPFDPGSRGGLVYNCVRSVPPRFRACGALGSWGLGSGPLRLTWTRFLFSAVCRSGRCYQEVDTGRGTRSSWPTQDLFFFLYYPAARLRA